MKKICCVLLVGVCMLLSAVAQDPPYGPAVALEPIVKAEYFIDNLTEFGSGTNIPGATGNTIDLQSFPINSSNLSVGFHRLYIRTKDAAGRWSITNQKQFYVFNEPAYAVANPLSDITKAEYFFDNLTEFGNGIDIPLTTGTSIDLQSIQINTDNLSSGFHRLYIRTKDGSGKWSITNQKQFYVFNEPPYGVANPLSDITKAEYFIDNLTEFGNGTDIPLNVGTSLNLQAIEINTNSLSSGFHRLYIRTRDASGKWSITNQKQFYVFNEPAYAVANLLSDITKAEYFFDNLTEFGNGTDIPLATGTSIDLQTLEINTSGLNSGFHRLYIRTKDASGKWSITNQKQFYVFNEPAYTVANPLLEITKAEYFIDNLTEFGNGQDIPLTTGTSIDLQTLEINTGNLSSGFHRLYIRTKDASGKWSITNQKQFYVFNEPAYAVANPLSDITKAEYFFDNLTEFGNGQDIPLTTGTSIDLQTLEINTGNLSSGLHRLYIRTKDASGKWSITNQKQFYVFNEPAYTVANPLSDITKAEYFIDNLTEFGNGQDIPLTTGTSIDLQTLEINTGNLSSGFHRLYIRTKDASGKWSITNQKQFYVFNEPAYAVANPLSEITKAEYYFDNLTEFGAGTDIPLTSGTTIDLQHILINTSGLLQGHHHLYIRTQDATGKWSITNQRIIYVGELQPYVDFQNSEYYIKPAGTLIPSGQTLADFNYSTALTTHEIFNDGIYFPKVDYLGNNVWLRVRHIADDPNGTTVGYNVTKTANSPFRLGGFGGWWGFLYQFDVYKDINVTGTPGYVLNGLFPVNVQVESIETLSASEWISFEGLNSECSNWGLNTINFSGNNPNSNPGFSANNIPYGTLSSFSSLFPAASKNIYAVDKGSAPGYAEFRMGADEVSQFTCGYEYPNAGGYQGIRLYLGLPPRPLNEACSDATTLTPSADISFAGTAGTLNFATASSFLDCDQKQNADVWYKFTATEKYHRVVLKNTVRPDSMRFQLYGGNCSSFYTIACVLNSRDSVVYDATDLRIGYTYYLRVYSMNSFTTNGNFDIGIVLPPLSINKGLNILTNASFETPAMTAQATGVGNSFNGWFNRLGNPIAIIKEVSYPIAFGPDTASTGKQYIDMFGYDDTLYHPFSISTTSTVFFSGHFTNQAAQYYSSTYVPWTGFCGIMDENNVLVAKSDIMNFTNKLTDKAWYQLSGTVYDLPPGNYKYIAFVSNYSNFDNAFVQANFNCPLLSQPPTSVTSNDADNTICNGSSVTLTANGAVPANGAIYIWYEGNCIDGLQIGMGPTLTLIPSSGSHNYSVVLQETCGYTDCASINIAVSQEPLVTVSIATTANPNSVCAGSSVTFTAATTNSGNIATYEWKINGQHVGSSQPSFTSTNLAGNDVITCTVITVCGAEITSNSIIITGVYPVLNNTISITTSSTTICAGSYVSFVATAPNVGYNPVRYKWRKNGTVVSDINLTFPSSTIFDQSFYEAYNLVTGDIITCEVSSSTACTLPATAFSNAITMSVSPANNASVSIDITSGTNPDCSGGPLTFTATPINGGTTPTYEWHLITGFPATNIVVGTNSPVFTLDNPAHNDVVYCNMTSSIICSNPTVASSNSITVKAPTVLTGYINCNSNCNGSAMVSTCGAATIQFSAISWNIINSFYYTNSSPSFQWQLNGTNVGSNSSNYSQTGFTNGDVITCTVVSTEPCSSPASLTLSMTVSVYDISSASLSIYGPESVCSGSLASYSAQAVNAGPNPTYEWKLERNNVVSIVSTNYYYESNALITGDVITCSVTTDPVCANPITVQSSNSITITVTQSVTPTIAIAATHPVTSLANVFTATVTNAGPNPVYHWKKNGSDVGFNSSTYLDFSLINGDVITCILESDAPCATASVVSSNNIVVGTPAYCIPNTIYPGNQSCTYAWIDNVILGTTINHASGCSGLYSDYTATDTVRSAAGQTVEFTISAGDNGSNYGLGTSIYIDYNRDGDFEDAGELVIDNGYMYVGNDATGTFVIPSSLTAGSYRVRVISDFYPVSSSCITNYGEAEDYILQVTHCTPGPIYGNTACTYSWISNVILGTTVNHASGCGGFYTDYTATDTLKTTSGQTVNFAIATDDGGNGYSRNCSIYIDYNSDGDFEDLGEKVADNLPSFNGSDATGSFIVPQLILPGSYRLRVISNNIVTSPCETDYGEAEDYILQIPQPDYCVPVISNPCTMWMSNVTIGTINNTSAQPVNCGGGGYTDYSSLLSTIAAPGQTINFSLTGQTSNYNYPWQYADIYIDFNQDGDFDDVDERVAADIYLYTGNATTGTFNIPAGQSFGYYRMRVKSYDYYEPQSGPCGDNTSGEIEDYVLIVRCVSNGSDISVAGNSIEITDGDISPDINDHTDFGNVELGNNQVRTFTITNTGTNTLNIGNVTLAGGTNNTAFSIASQPVLNVLIAGASTTFSVQFDSPVWGYGFNFNTTVHVASDHCDKRDYDFAIQATASCPLNGPDINLQGNGIDIARFDFTPDPVDNTDFGTVTANNTLSKTFVIQNTGIADLNISDIQLFNYDNLLQFTVATQPASIVTPGSSTSFTISFSPAGFGSRYVYVRVNSNDCDESYYNFLIIGEAACPALIAEVNVKGNGIDIVDGDNTPADADNTNFGLAALNTSVSKTFVVENTGIDPMNISGVTFTGTGAADFSVTTAPAATVAPGSSTSFTVQFLSTVSGLKLATMHVNNSDCDEGDYDIAVRGTDGTVCTPVIVLPCDYMYINNVTIGSINNNSACSYGSGYSDYTATQSDMAAPGSTVQFSASAYGNEQKVNVYIDYNKDGDFEDAGEMVLSDLYMYPGAVNAAGSFVVPQTQAPDNYRVRVISQWNYHDTLTPCYSYYGEAEDYTLIVQSNSLITVNLKLFLQGYYNGNQTMQPVLNNQAVPLSQSNETDTITVELHDPVTYALVDTKQAVLQTDGTVAAVFDQPAAAYYIAIKHRNTLQTWSTDPVDCPTQTRYDFSIAAGNAMGDNQFEVELGVWAMFTGDLNQDDYIDGSDFPLYDFESASGGLYDGTYTATDMNGDGFVDGSDFPVFDGNSSNAVTSIHP